MIIMSYSRSYTDPTYSHRYGFNGMPEDNELKGEGNSLDFGARFYDPRVGRFLSLDPLYNKYPNLSPYVAFADNPVMFVDPDGRIITDALRTNVVTPLDNWYTNSINTLLNMDCKGNVDKENLRTTLLSRARIEYSEFQAQVQVLNASLIKYDYFQAYVPVNPNVGGKIRPEVVKNDDKILLSWSIGIQLNFHQQNNENKRHEWEHLFDFEMCRINFKSNGDAGYFYDRHDEVKAFNKMYTIMDINQFINGYGNFYRLMEPRTIDNLDRNYNNLSKQDLGLFNNDGSINFNTFQNELSVDVLDQLSIFNYHRVTDAVKNTIEGHQNSEATRTE